MLNHLMEKLAEDLEKLHDRVTGSVVHMRVPGNDQKQKIYRLVHVVGTGKTSEPYKIRDKTGPGCSVVGVGAFSENGPFRPRGQVLFRNEHSWNKEANMLYLESPVGIGFSYSTKTYFYETVNDEIIARDTVVFLQRWFNKFPKYILFMENHSVNATVQSDIMHWPFKVVAGPGDKLMIVVNYKGEEKQFAS